METDTPQDSSVRTVAHFLLAIPTLLGLALLFFVVANSAQTTATETHVSALALESWTAAVAEIPAEMPLVWSDEVDPDPESIDDLDENTRKRWGLTNAFLFSCSILVFLGGVGIASATAGRTRKEPPWFPLLRFGALLPVTFCIWLLWGFNLAYPGENSGPVPHLYLGFPDSDPVFYGMGGMTGWTDFFFITSYAVLASALFLSFAAENIRATSLLLIALPFLAIGFPIVISWKWGAGWIEMLDNNTDFAGGALLHWHVGAFALVAGLVLTVFRKQSKRTEDPATTRPNLVFFGAGGALYFLGLVGMNAGSTLDSDPAPVAAVLQATIAAAVVSATLSTIWWIGFRNRSILEMFFIGLISGSVIVSGAADSLDWTRTLVFGIVSGMIVPGLVVAMDRIGWVDPLAVGPVHGIAGLLGTIGAAFCDYGDDFPVSLSGQLILVGIVPIGTIATTIAVLVFFGAIGFLFREHHHSSSAANGKRVPGQPPPLPPGR